MDITNSSSHRQVMIIVWIFIIINAVFLFSVSLLPFIDLPNHLAEATIFKYHGTPGNRLSQFYTPAPWYFPNTFHTVFCSLLPSVEVGNVVFHILCIALLPISLYLVIRELNGNLWYGLLGLLFTYNYNVTYGFVGFAISIPTIIILFYVTLRDIREDGLPLKVMIAFLLVMLFLMHAQNALFGLLLYGIMMLYKYGRSFKKLVTRAVFVPLPLLLLIFVWWFTRPAVNEESTAGYLLDYYTSEYFSKFFLRFGIVVFDNFQLRAGLQGVVVAAIIFTLIFIPLVALKPWRSKPVRTLISGNTLYPLILFVVSLGCYLFLPDKLPGQTPLFQRFTTMVLLSFIILVSVWTGPVRVPWLRYFSVGAAAVYMMLWFEYIYAFNRENSDFTKELFTEVNNRSRLAGLIYDNKYRGRLVYIHYPNYFLVWKHGISASKIIDYRFGIVRRATLESEIPFYNELIGEGYRLLPEYAALEYLLVRGEAPVKPDVNLANFSLLTRAGAWQLYQHKKLQTAVNHAQP